jgi:hypothetical protein
MVKLSGKFILYLIKHRVTNTYCGGGGSIWSTAPPFLTSALDGGERLASSRSRFTPVKKFPVPIEYDAEWAPKPVWKL